MKPVGHCRRWRILICLLLPLAACDSNGPPVELKVSVGERFPALQLEDLQGKPLTLARQHDPLILNVWATWCPPCRKELPGLQRLQKRLQNDGVSVLGMAVEADAHVVREYLIDRGIEFTSYLDPQMRMANQVLGVRLYPATFIIDGKGVLRMIVEGERDWDDSAIADQVRQALDLHSGA